METAGSFGTWLKADRKRRRLTQAALGEIVSYSADHIRKVEADERRFGEAQARLLAELVGMPLQDHDAFVTWARGGTPPPGFALTAAVLAQAAPHFPVPEPPVRSAPPVDPSPPSPEWGDSLVLQEVGTPHVSPRR